MATIDIMCACVCVVRELVQCACEMAGRAPADHVTFGEFAVFVTELQELYRRQRSVGPSLRRNHTLYTPRPLQGGVLVLKHHAIPSIHRWTALVSCCSIRSLELSATEHPVITLFDCFSSTP